MRRTAGTVAIALTLLAAAAAVTPDVTGVDVEVIENGNRIEVSNMTDEDLVVLGYQGAPYLRIGPDGVFENARSPATHLNQDRRATPPVPGTAGPEAEPERRRAAAFAGIFIAFNGGLIDVGDLSRSYVPFTGPEALVRVAVASSLGLGVGLVVAAFLRLRSPAPAPRTW